MGVRAALPYISGQYLFLVEKNLSTSQVVLAGPCVNREAIKIRGYFGCILYQCFSGCNLCFYSVVYIYLEENWIDTPGFTNLKQVHFPVL